MASWIIWNTVFTCCWNIIRLHTRYFDTCSDSKSSHTFWITPILWAVLSVIINWICSRISYWNGFDFSECAIHRHGSTKNTYTTIRNEWMKYKLIKRKHLKNLKTYETLQEDGWKHPTTNQLNKRPNKLNTYQLNKDRYIKHSKNFLLLSAKLKAKAINNITEQRLVSVFYQTIVILCEN